MTTAVYNTPRFPVFLLPPPPPLPLLLLFLYDPGQLIGPFVLELKKRNQSGVPAGSEVALPDFDFAVVSVSVLGQLVVEGLDAALNIPLDERSSRDFFRHYILEGFKSCQSIKVFLSSSQVFNCPIEACLEHNALYNPVYQRYKLVKSGRLNPNNLPIAPRTLKFCWILSFSSINFKASYYKY